MKKITEFNSYEECVAYTYPKTSFISSSSMGIYLAQHGVFQYLKDLSEGKYDTPVYHEDDNGAVIADVNGIPIVDYYTPHPAKEFVSLLFASLNKTNSDGRDFNFIQTGDDQNVINKGNAVVGMFDLIIGYTPDKSAELTALKNFCIGICNRTEQPYKDLTLAEYTEANFEPQSVEASLQGAYSEGYIITTGTQGVDCVITSDKDCKVTVYLAVCTDSQDQRVLTNYSEQMPVGVVTVKNGKGFLALSSRKVRAYNKFYVKADNDAVLELTVSTNRG